MTSRQIRGFESKHLSPDRRSEAPIAASLTKGGYLLFTGNVDRFVIFSADDVVRIADLPNNLNYERVSKIHNKMQDGTKFSINAT